MRDVCGGFFNLENKSKVVLPIRKSVVMTSHKQKHGALWAAEGQLRRWPVPGDLAWVQQRGLEGLCRESSLRCPVKALEFPLAAWSCTEFQEGVRYARGRHWKYNKT